MISSLMIQNKLSVFTKYVYTIFALFISACIYNLLVYPLKIVYGGAGGLATIASFYLNIEPSIFILLFSIIVLLVGKLILGLKKVSGSIIATFLYPFFVNITSGLNTIIKVDSANTLLLVFYIGILTGITAGIIYKMGFSSGGVALLVQIIAEKSKISISQCSFIVNALIVMVGGLSFGYTNCLYAIIILYINSIVINKIIVGISRYKLIYIITNKSEEIKNYIMNTLGKNVTMFSTIGIDSSKHEMIVSALPTRNYYEITNYIKDIDPKAFYTVIDSYEVKPNVRNKK